MQKYKICPHCGIHNDPKMLECDGCGEDLSSVTLTDDEIEEERIANNVSGNAANIGRMIRICDECGAKNPPNANICISCGEDISMILREEDVQEEKQHYVLSAVDENYEYEIFENQIVVGREKEMGEYLVSKSYVSRIHAALSIEEGNLYVENMSRTNYTFVNNARVNDGDKKELKDGDELQLGGNGIDGNRQKLAAYFKVRIGTCI